LYPESRQPLTFSPIACPRFSRPGTDWIEFSLLGTHSPTGHDRNACQTDLINGFVTDKFRQNPFLRVQLGEICEPVLAAPHGLAINRSRLYPKRTQSLTAT
jgi:hypothetical protein